MAIKFYKGLKPLLSQPSIGGGLMGRAYVGGQLAYGTSPGPSLPAVVQDFVFFYSADQGSSWTDQSGNGNDGTESVIGSGGTSAITYNAGGAPFWEFTAPNPTSEQRYVDTGIAPGLQGDLTLFVVFQDTDTSDNANLILAFDGGTDQLSIGTSRSTVTIFSNIRGTSNVSNLSLAPYIAQDTWFSAVSRQSISSNTSTILVNNINRTLNPGSGVGTATNIDVSANYTVGRAILSGTQSSNMKIAAAGAAHKRLNDTELTELYDYYNAIYSF